MLELLLLNATFQDDVTNKFFSDLVIITSALLQV